MLYSIYKKTIVYLFLAVILVIVFSAASGRNPAEIGRYLLAQAGSAMRASVPPNRDSIVAAQLQQRESELGAQEKAVAEREAATDANNQIMLRYFMAGGGVLLMLIMLNFYFDWRRRRGEEKFKIIKKNLKDTTQVFSLK
jgi:hypothetical protein